MTDQITLRALQMVDCLEISKAFTNQGWSKPVTQFQKYFDLQLQGLRDIIVAESGGDFAGYLTIQWQSDYIPFKERKIPEIVDFNVLKKYQRKGIGTRLMDEAEKRISEVSKIVGIGVGVYEDYGAAQILYIKRNYIPDGNGLVQNSRPLKYGENVIVDDSLVMCLTKKLCLP